MPIRSPRHANHPVLVSLGAEIRRTRSEMGISQERLALETEIDRSYLGAIERGEQNVGILHLWRICQALRISLADIALKSQL